MRDRKYILEHFPVNTLESYEEILTSCRFSLEDELIAAFELLNIDFIEFQNIPFFDDKKSLLKYKYYATHFELCSSKYDNEHKEFLNLFKKLAKISMDRISMHSLMTEHRDKLSKFSRGLSALYQRNEFYKSDSIEPELMVSHHRDVVTWLTDNFANDEESLIALIEVTQGNVDQIFEMIKENLPKYSYKPDYKNENSNTLEVNKKIILETLSNDFASLFMPVQQKKLLITSYKNGAVKFILQAVRMNKSELSYDHPGQVLLMVREGIATITDKSIVHTSRHFIPLLFTDKNLTALMSGTLCERMQSAYILAKMKGLNVDESIIATYGDAFKQFYNNFSANEANILCDDYVTAITGLQKNDYKNRMEYDIYIQAIQEFKQCMNNDLDAFVDMFKKYLYLPAPVVELADNLNKLCASAFGKTSLRSQNGKHGLNHLMIHLDYHKTWDVEFTDNQYILNCPFDKEQLHVIEKCFKGKFSPNLLMIVHDGKFSVRFHKNHLDEIAELFNEDSVKHKYHKADFDVIQSGYNEIKLRQLVNAPWFKNKNIAMELGLSPHDQNQYQLTLHIKNDTSAAEVLLAIVENAIGLRFVNNTLILYFKPNQLNEIINKLELIKINYVDIYEMTDSRMIKNTKISDVTPDVQVSIEKEIPIMNVRQERPVITEVPVISMEQEKPVINIMREDGVDNKIHRVETKTTPVDLVINQDIETETSSTDFAVNKNTEIQTIANGVEIKDEWEPSPEAEQIPVDEAVKTNEALRSIQKNTMENFRKVLGELVEAYETAAYAEISTANSTVSLLYGSFYYVGKNVVNSVWGATANSSATLLPHLKKYLAVDNPVNTEEIKGLLIKRMDYVNTSLLKTAPDKYSTEIKNLDFAISCAKLLDDTKSLGDTRSYSYSPVY